VYAQENQAKLFKSVVQFDAAKLQGGMGTGLGMLSECQRTYTFIRPYLIILVFLVASLVYP